MPVIKYVQEEDSEPNPIQRRINQLIEVHQEREVLCEKVQGYQNKVEQVFDKRAKMNSFKLGDMVLKWDSRYEDKFDELWKGPFSISAFAGRNAFFLKDLEGDRVGVGPVNGRFLKLYSS